MSRSSIRVFSKVAHHPRRDILDLSSVRISGKYESVRMKRVGTLMTYLGGIDEILTSKVLVLQSKMA